MKMYDGKVESHPLFTHKGFEGSLMFGMKETIKSLQDFVQLQKLLIHL